MKKGKKAQMNLSFGMIFSIILVIVIVSFAFYVIKIFLDNQVQTKVLMFKDDLQKDVDNLWRGSGSLENEYEIPDKIEKVCFADFSSSAKGKNQAIYVDLKRVYNGNENLVFYPVGSANGLDSTEIKHINLEEITNSENPYCIENSGEIKLTIKRDYGEDKVLIKR